MVKRRSGLLVLDAERAALPAGELPPEAWRDFLETVAAFSPIDELTTVCRERDFEALAATAAAMNDSLGLALALSAPSVYRRLELRDERADEPAWGERWAERYERLLRESERYRRGRALVWSEVSAERSAIVCFEAGGESLAVQAAATAGCPIWRAARPGCEGPVRQVVVWDDGGTARETESLKEAAAVLADRYQTTWRIQRPARNAWWRRATGRSRASCGDTFEADEWVVCASEPSGWARRLLNRRRLARLLSGCAGPVLMLPVGKRLATARSVSAQVLQAAGAD